MATPDELIQMLMIGQAPESWRFGSERLRRGAEVIFQVARAGCKRLAKLSLAGPDPPPGQTLTRECTPEEVAALVDQDLHRIASLLLAYAIEVELKAALPGKVGPDGLLQQKANSHDLPKLASGVGLAVTAEEADLLADLSEYSKWRGRYPIPTKPKDLRDRPGRTRRYSFGELLECGFRLHDRIARELRNRGVPKG